MTYIAESHFPGCLPDTVEELPTFETAAEGWRSLIDGLGDDAWAPDNEDDPDGPASLTPAVLAMEELERQGRHGNVEGYGRIFSVDFAEEVAR